MERFGALPEHFFGPQFHPENIGTYGKARGGDAGEAWEGLPVPGVVMPHITCPNELYALRHRPPTPLVLIRLTVVTA
jgi:hypothetical protein